MTNQFRFSFPDENALVFTGATARYKANIAALKILKELEAAREDPTAEQLQAERPTKMLSSMQEMMQLLEL